MPALQLIFWRTLVASLALSLLIRANKTPLRIEPKRALQLLGTGVIVGLHWILFFSAVKVAGASMGMIGLSTATLWVALLAPIFIGRRISWLEFGLGVVVMIALSIIAHADYSRVWGLTLSIASAFLAAVFSYLNGAFAKRIHHNVIAFYEFVGAFLTTAVAIPFFSPGGMQLPSLVDWCLIFVLAIGCTVYAYAASVELLKRLSVFVVNLAVNLEPVYGMILAALLLGEHHLLNKQFYGGASIIITAVLCYPFLKRFKWNP